MTKKLDAILLPAATLKSWSAGFVFCAVLCAYPFGFPPGKKTFPQRNRIVAALACGVLAVEAPIPSGTLITCTFAKELGRKLMAIPANLDSVNSAGCWKLIREGATMVTSPEDVVALCGGKSQVASSAPFPMSAPQAPKPQLTLEEAAILRAIPSTGITLDRLAFAVKLPAAKVGDVTMSLRLKRLIRFLPGNRVAPAKK